MKNLVQAGLVTEIGPLSKCPKFKPQSHMGSFLGPVDEHGTAHHLTNDTKQVILTRDVVFQEDILPAWPGLEPALMPVATTVPTLHPQALASLLPPITPIQLPDNSYSSDRDQCLHNTSYQEDHSIWLISSRGKSFNNPTSPACPDSPSSPTPNSTPNTYNKATTGHQVEGSHGH
jgi:hypothetical protein